MDKLGDRWWKKGNPVLICGFVMMVLSCVPNSASFGQAPPGNAPPAPSAEQMPSAEQAPAAGPAGEPANTPATSESESPGEAQASALPAPPPLKKRQEALLKPDFTYSPSGMLDPFAPFLAAVEVAAVKPPSQDLDDEPEPQPEPEMQRPLTPLQKMTLAEIERGLKAITWGDLGRRAVIEDSAGKGYIVSVGTPAGERNGVITQIFNDHLVVQQDVWDKEQKKVVPQNSVVRLWKVKPQ